MKRVYQLSSALLCGMVLSACGTEASLNTSAASDEAQATLSCAPLHASAACEEIFADLRVSREALATTAEWEGLAETDAFKTFKATTELLGKAHCTPHETDPSATCTGLKQKMHSDWQAVKATDAYKKAEATEAYAKVRDDYKRARDNHCWG